MRITTVGVLATLGMILSSTAVWSATSAEPGTADSQADAQTGNQQDWRDGREDPKDPKLDSKQGDDSKAPPIVDKSTFVAGKALMLEGRLGHAKMLADAQGETFLYVDIRSDQANLDQFGQTGAEPLNLAIVIDHSGSMKGQRQRNAIDAAAGMIRRLRDGDTVSVVAYSDTARQVVPVTTMTTVSRERIIADMRSGIESDPNGHTCISCGIELGMRTLAGRRAGIDRMLLLSDGEANRGISDEAGIRVLARQARNGGTTISSIGVDVDYNERLMSALAREANGRHYFSETGENLEQIFDQELESLITAVAKDAKLVVELAPGVRVAEVLDRSYQQVDRRVIVPMGTFAVGETKTFLLRLDVPPSPVGERPIAAVTFTYDDLSSQARANAGERQGECFGELAAQMIASPSEVSPFDAIVLGRLTKSETARALESANRLFAEGRTSEAQAIVDSQVAEIGERRKQASSASGAAGFFDPFNRDLDNDFDAQAEVLNDANAGFDEAAAAPEPAPTSRPGKAQVRRNAEQADAFSL